MTPKLTDELRQALAKQPEQPLQMEDPVTHARYVLVRLDTFEQLQRAASQPDPRAFYPSFAEAVKAGLDTPGMDAYDDPTASPKL